jgi:hypothetical protein
MRRTIAPGVLLFLFCLVCLPLSLSVRSGNFAEDERGYYLPSIARISAHWPRVDLAGDATSATSPGYAYLLAGVSRLTGQDPRVFRMITIATSAAVLGLLLLMFEAPRAGAACAAILPLAASNFFIKSSAWVVTDNAALLWSCASLLLLWKCHENQRWSLPAGLSAAAAVLTRQLHAWLVVPIACVAFMGAAPGGTRQPPSIRILAWLALVPPLAALSWIVHAWGGIVPPAWRETHDAGIHPASVACALSVFGALGIFYLLAAESPLGALRLARSGEAVCGAAVGFLTAIAAPNAMDYAEGRWGGYYWQLVKSTPSPWGRSVLIVAGSIAGGALVGAMARRLHRSAGSYLAVLWLAAAASWLAACALNRLAFQRYYEPSILVFLISWLALLANSRGKAEGTILRYGPLVTLAVAQAVISLLTTFIPVLAG